MEESDNMFWDIIDNEFGEGPYGDDFFPTLPNFTILKPAPNIIIMITEEYYGQE